MSIKGIGFDIDGTLYNNIFMYICTIPSFLMHPRLVWHYGRCRSEIRNIRPDRKLQKGAGCTGG